MAELSKNLCMLRQALSVIICELHSISVALELNSREIALLIWLVIALAWALSQRSIRSSMFKVVQLVCFNRFLTPIFLLSAVYTAIVILCLQRFSFWESSMIKVAIAWYFGSGLIVLFDTSPVRAGYFRRLILKNVALGAFVEFVVNAKPFPLAIEIILFPALLTLSMLRVVADQDKKYVAVLVLVNCLLVIIGATLIVHTILAVSHDLKSVLTIQKLEEFLLPLLLSIGYVPFLYLVRLFSILQTTLHMVKFGMQEHPHMFRTARRLILKACGFSLKRADLFERRFRARLWGVDTETEVCAVIAEFREAYQNPSADV